MFINLFKIWLITICHALFRSRIPETCQPGDNWGCWWGLLLLIQFYEGNILNRDRLVLVRGVSFHSEALSAWVETGPIAILPVMRQCTPELSGSMFPMYSNDDLVPLCELSLWISSRLACLIQLWGKASSICQCLQQLSRVCPWNPCLWRFNQIKTNLLCISFGFCFLNCEFIPCKYNKTLPNQKT